MLTTILKAGIRLYRRQVTCRINDRGQMIRIYADASGRSHGLLLDAGEQ